jgi:hypothetical protein
MEPNCKNLTNFFQKILTNLKCREDTNAYIISIYAKYITADFDLSQDSVSLLFLEARQKQDFMIYQNLADWIFFINTTMPKHLRYASKDYYDTIARSSYYSCYKIIKRQWKLFEELSDNFTTLEHEVKHRLQPLRFEYDDIF